MKSKIVATLAVAVVAFMVFATAGATTYSWFSDSDETDITVTTAKINISAYWNGNAIEDTFEDPISQSMFSSAISNIAPGLASDNTYENGANTVTTMGLKWSLLNFEQ